MKHTKQVDTCRYQLNYHTRGLARPIGSAQISIRTQNTKVHSQERDLLMTEKE